MRSSIVVMHGCSVAVTGHFKSKKQVTHYSPKVLPEANHDTITFHMLVIT